MSTISLRSFSAALAGAVISLTMVSCETPADVAATHDHDASFARVGTGGLSGLAKSVRQATARYHSTNQALSAGYAPDPECVAIPGVAGMGHHWVNFDLVDPVFEPLVPEVVLYEPGPNGKLHLVAVEYIIVDVGQPDPSFDGQAFDYNGAPLPFDHWALHVWVHKENPNGLFTPFNPSVSCP